MTLSLRSLVALVPITAIVIACGNGAADDNSRASESDLSRIGTSGEVSSSGTVVILPPPGPTPATCMASCTSLPHCSFGYFVDDSGREAQKLLGCGPVYKWMNGANSGILGGNGSFCPDTPSNRKYLHDNHYTGFLPGYCDTCLNVPCGKIFVFWEYEIGPTCPSGCTVGRGGGDI